jgi:serine protease
MRFKHFIALFAVGIFLWGCAKDDLQTTADTDHNDPLTKSEINDFVRQKLEKENRFYWTMADDHMLWSAAVLSDSILSIGYQPVEEGDISDRMHLIDIQSEEWVAVKEELIDFIVDETNKAFPGTAVSARDLMPFKPQTVLPVINIKVYDENIIHALREMPQVRYIDPTGYTPQEIYARDAGCDNSPAGFITPDDYTTVSPNAKVPWNFYNMNIPQAWNHSTGDGVRVAVIDTGVSPNQSKMGSEFNSGQSQGRSITKLGTYVSSWWWWASPDGPDDQCGHGTAMAGLVGAPRSTTGSSVGVAYNADLMTIRACADVVIYGSREVNGVSDAIVIAGSTSDVRVLSMSIGSVFYYGQINDAINYTYGQGKMLVCAAGTSTSFTNWYGVIFPAYLSKTVAVTGIKEGAPYNVVIYAIVVAR